MHFKLDLKEKKTLMKKGKSVANGTFFSKIIPLPCPFSCFWRMGHFYLQHLWIDGGDGWKSASERPIWSAFNGLEWKAGEGDHTFSSSFCRECYFWNFLSGIIHRAFFFWFSVFIVHELFLWDSEAAPATIVLSLSWNCLISSRKNGQS